MIKSVTAVISSLIILFSSSTGLFTQQLDSLQSIREIEDNMYIMDYTYDYDIDEMMSTDINTSISLVLYGLSNTMSSKTGCTTFNSVSGSGDYIMGRNYDYMDSGMMLMRTTPEDGYTSISSVSLYFFGYQDNLQPDDEASSLLCLLAPYACVDGMNEKGLCISVLELETDPTFQMTSKPNLTTTTMIRACLDKAATVDEAIGIFRSYDMRDMLFGDCCYHYQISDAKGNTCIIEYPDGELNVIYPEHSASNQVDYMGATNFWLSEGVDDPDGLGQDRYDTAMSALKKTNGVAGEKAAMNILKACSVRDEDMNGYICSTLWSNVFNMTDRTVNVCFNGNYNRVYRFSMNKSLNDQI